MPSIRLSIRPHHIDNVEESISFAWYASVARADAETVQDLFRQLRDTFGFSATDVMLLVRYNLVKRKDRDVDSGA